jgi:membrane protein
MEINLALNTIIYIMIFIVPGILFRNYFYSGEYSKEFYFGNLFERFVWTLFFSVLMLITCYFFIYLFSWSGVNLISEISYDTIKEIYENLHNVQSDITFPDKKTFDEKSGDFFIIIFILYTISGLLGFICNKLATILNFNFYNYWHALFRGKLNKAPKGFKYIYTDIDILTTDHIIYTGKIKNYHLSKNDTNIETIVIENTSKKEIGKYSPEYPFGKSIEGHNFCIHKDQIQNMNLSYIYEKRIGLLGKLINRIGILLYVALLPFVFYIFFSEIPFLDSLLRKLFFISAIFMVVTPIADTMIDNTKIPKDSIPVFITFGWLAVWLYLQKSILLYIIVLLISLIIYIRINMIFQKKNKDQKEEEKE